MKTSIARIIPAVTKEGLSIEIPRSAWNDIEAFAQELGVDFEVWYQPVTEESVDGPAVPRAYYFVQMRLDLRKVAHALFARMDRMIDDLVERHTPLAVLA